MASEADETRLDDGEWGCDRKTADVAEPPVTVTITVERWSKRVRMVVSGPPETVRWAVDRFWRGMHYDV